jgi:hypothetical protein
MRGCDFLQVNPRSSIWRAVVAAMFCCVTGAQAFAHGIVGQRSFIEPFITEDANPKNEFVIARPEWDESRDARSLGLGFGLEKKLSDRFSITLDSEWDSISPRDPDEPQATGFNNLGITLKDAFYLSPPHEFIVSGALEATAPTGTTDVDAERDRSFNPFLLYGKGFGDLPRSVQYLRPFAVQGDVGCEVSIDHDRSTTVAHNIVLEYSIPYLQSFVRDVGLGWPLNDFVPVTEFNFEHGVNGEERGKSRIFATPGLVYMDRYVELGMAGRFPLNDRAHQDLDWGLIWIVDLFLDDIFLATQWQPL